MRLRRSASERRVAAEARKDSTSLGSTTSPDPFRAIVRAARFAPGTAASSGREAQWDVRTFDGTEYTPASPSRIVTRTSADASTDGSDWYGWKGRRVRLEMPSRAVASRSQS